jgi:hypothetical protein
MNAQTYENLLFICKNGYAPDSLKGKEHRIERGNLMRKRFMYTVRNDKLYYVKTDYVETPVQIPDAPPLALNEEPKESVHFKIVRTKVTTELEQIHEKDLTNILEKFHDDPLFGGHQGRDKMKEAISRHYYDKHLNKYIVQHINECTVCKKWKRNFTTVPLQPIVLNEGFPESLQNDNGGEFIGDVVKKVLELCAVKQIRIAAYRRSSVGFNNSLRSEDLAVHRAFLYSQIQKKTALAEQKMIERHAKKCKVTKYDIGDIVLVSNPPEKRKKESKCVTATCSSL